MRLILADVISVNGKITKGDDPDIHAWSSNEDWEHFVSLREQSDVVIIDQHTYETVHPDPEKGKLRIVIAPAPEHYKGAGIPGQLEFTDLAVKELVTRLKQEGCQTVLVAGGAGLCSSFLEAHLVDELYITFEPVLFGTGEPMLGGAAFSLSLQLQSIKQLNVRGTLLAHYTVLSSD